MVVGGGGGAPPPPPDCGISSIRQMRRWFARSLASRAWRQWDFLMLAWRRGACDGGGLNAGAGCEGEDAASGGIEE